MKTEKNSILPTLNHKALVWYYALLCLLTLVLFGNSIGNGYGLDDNLVTNQNPLIKKGFNALPEIFTTNYVNQKDLKFEYRPLVKASYAIEYALFKFRPKVSHFINVVLYALTACLLFYFLAMLLNKQNLWLPLLTAIIFIAHPIHTEPVNNLKSRDEILALLFALWAAIYFIRYVDSGKATNLVWGGLIFILALMSKGSVLVFIALVPLCIYFFRNNVKQAAKSGGVLLGLALVFYGLVLLMLPSIGRELKMIEAPLADSNDWNLKLGSAAAWTVQYLRLLIWPYPLAFYYGYNQLPIVGLASPLAILSIVIHLGLLGFGIWGFKNRNILSFAALFYLIAISPFANIVSPVVGIIGERMAYVASIGFCLALAYGVLKITKLDTSSSTKLRPNNKLYVALTLFLLPYSFLTITRNSQWKDALTLFRHDIAYLPNSVKANFELARELTRNYRKLSPHPKNYEKRAKLASEALECYKRMIAQTPTMAAYHRQAGLILSLDLGKPTEAIPYLRKANNLKNPVSAKYVYDLGNAFLLAKQTDSAEVYFLKTLELDSLQPETHYHLAKIAYDRKDTISGRSIVGRMLALMPESHLPYLVQGDYLTAQGDTARAKIWYAKGNDLYRRKQQNKFYNNDTNDDNN